MSPNQQDINVALKNNNHKNDDNIAWKKRRKLAPNELLKKAPAIIEDLKVDSHFFQDNECRNLASFSHDGKAKKQTKMYLN